MPEPPRGTGQGSKRVEFVDVTTRDAHQSLWATRMTTAMMLPFVRSMDTLGFAAVNLVGGAVFDVCVRYLHEDPWQRIRLVRERLDVTPIDVMTRGQSLFTFEFFPDDVVALSIRRIAATGARRVTVYDALNDVRNLELSVDVAHEEGMYVTAALVYTLSPVHTDTYYEGIARDLVDAGADAVMIKDPSGLLAPDRVRTLVPAVKKATGALPLELHSHSLSGLAEWCYLEAVPLGVDVLHTASTPLASGASLPPTPYCAEHLSHAGFAHRLSLDGLATMDDYFAGVARRHGFPISVPRRYDPALYRHQVPGGMISNLRTQLREMGMEDREPEILEEAERVRMDLGYPILVSPFAQYVITQAVLNVVQGERYKTIPVEVRRYALGRYGRPAAPVAANLLDRMVAEDPELDQPITHRAGERVAPRLADLRATRGPFESEDDLLLAAFYSDEQLEPVRRTPMPMPSGPNASSPLRLLLSELASRSDFTSLSVERPGLRLRVTK